MATTNLLRSCICGADGVLKFQKLYIFRTWEITCVKNTCETDDVEVIGVLFIPVFLFYRFSFDSLSATSKEYCCCWKYTQSVSSQQTESSIYPISNQWGEQYKSGTTPVDVVSSEEAWQNIWHFMWNVFCVIFFPFQYHNNW